MQLISPVAASLAFIGSPPAYVNSDWASGQSYAKYAVRNYAPSGTTRYDYTCKIAHTSSSYITPSNIWYWTKGGLSTPTGGYTYTTNVRESNYPAWATGAAVAAWSTYYDAANHHDYLAPLAIAAGTNTIRPSEAVNSTDPAVAARWVDAGASNAWAPFDGLSNTYLQGYNSSNVLVSPATFTFSSQLTTEAGNRLFLSGLTNVKTVSATITATVTASGAAWGGTMVNPPATNLELTTWGVCRRSVVLPFTEVPVGHTLTVAVSLTASNTDLPVQCSVCGVGCGYTLGYTEWGVDISLLDFSRKERDEVYGTVDFIRRGNTKLLRATCYMDVSEASGDVVHYVLQTHTGRPLMLDFNNSPSVIYDRLLVYGFYSSVKTVINAGTFEVLSIDVEGLVE